MIEDRTALSRRDRAERRHAADALLQQTRDFLAGAARG
jgi:hypothetical protein